MTLVRMLCRVSLLDGFDGSAGDSFIFSQGQQFRTDFHPDSKHNDCNIGDMVGYHFLILGRIKNIMEFFTKGLIPPPFLGGKKDYIWGTSF